MTRTTTRRRLALTTALFLFTGLAVLAFATPVMAKKVCADDSTDDDCNNSGDVKVHTANDIGSTTNDPHVDCPFYVEGFNMDATSGDLTIKSWPPTGDKTVVIDSSWTADAGTPANHFLNGPYSLSSGHYKLFVEDSLNDKHKVFWVDCEDTTTTSTSTTTTSPGCQQDCTTTETTSGTPTTQIPFFPSTTSLLIGAGGAVMGTLLMIRRRL
jgi:hypothetical protein